MALADIIARIEADARAEADAIIADAQERAGRIIAAARAKSERDAERTIVRARTAATRDAETIVVRARLAARDGDVADQRVLIERALAATVNALADLPEDEYVVWLAARVAEAAQGGETLSLGSEDQSREDAVRAELARIASDLSLPRGSSPAPFPRGALLEGDRVRADLSLETIVADRRDSLELVVARALLSEEA